MSEIKETVEEVIEQRDRTNAKMSLRLHGIHSRVLSEIKDDIIELLTAVCNLSLKISLISEEGRVVNEAQIFKKVSRDDLQGCKPDV